jgi:orotidine-5'-phosphate decarboxylase
MDGIVASPLEITRIRRVCGKKFLLVVPGVRSAGDSWDDQKRVLTPAEAMQAGADYLVVGKPIRDAKDPRAAARQMVREMASGLSLTTPAIHLHNTAREQAPFLDRKPVAR